MNRPEALPEEFGVVVLNYNDHESTVSCVKSLVVCDPAPQKIVVVDNDSPNDSLAILQSTLGNVETVEVVDSGHNGGYSFGNNVGIRLLRDAGFKHIVIATSDTIVESPDLLPQLAAATRPSTGIVAPQIVSAGAFDNPSVERVTLRYLADLLWVRWSMPLALWRRRLAFLVRKMLPRKRISAQPTKDQARPSGPPRSVYKLHGAFLCLTDSYLSQIGPMDDDIFMFGEEDLMAYLCFKHGLAQTLVPSAIVHHAHDSSVNLTWGKKAEEFVDRAQKNSCRVLRKKIPMGPLIRAWSAGYPSKTQDLNNK